MYPLYFFHIQVQAAGGGGRKKREIPQELNRNATLAAHSMFRGFLNTLDAEDSQCARSIFCQSSYEASKFGEIGKSIAKISSFKAEEYLQEFNEELFEDISASGLVGILHNCDEVYQPCSTLPKSYRYPGYTDSSVLHRFSMFIEGDPIKVL